MVGLHDRIMRLRTAYIAKLPRVLEEARQSRARLAERPADGDALDGLHRSFHNLKGTAASLGLPEISAEGAAGARLVEALRHLDHHARPAALTEVDACILRLESLKAGASESGAPIEASAFAPAVVPASVPDVRRRVVFFCDNDLDGVTLGTQLSRFGYTIATFTDPDALKAAVLASPPDAVVMSTAGADLFADLRAAAVVPLLFVSEHADFATRLKAVKAGGEAYFLKPVSAHDVVDHLDAITVAREPEPFRVLIVDDEQEMADYHALILENAGMVAHRLADPERVLDALEEFQPDLILMDMYMPGCSGRELAAVIRQIPQFVSLPIIFLSSETDRMLQISAMRVGADGFLTKPIPPDDLVTAVAVRAERTRVLRSLMMRDGLTGLLNHTTLSQFLETALATAQRHKGQLCFVMLDLDHFKKVNDSFGHPAGDQVLVALARMLRQRFRNSDMIGRYGGEEFAAMLWNVSMDEAMQIVDQIRRDFSALTFTAGKVDFSCSFSGGIAASADYQTVEAIVQAADQALYASKHGGRNQISMALADSVREAD